MLQREALDILKMGGNVFLTGPAGSGKTFVLNEYVNYLKQNYISVAITASTGIAATHLGGITIHAFTGLGVRNVLTDYDIENLLEKQYLYKRFEKTKVLIIDEISMLSGQTLTMVDWICRSFKRNDAPFGGMQVIFCGDFFQLPPISRDFENADFAYESDVWKQARLSICYLSENHRHKDDVYLEVLHKIRRAEIDSSLRKILNGRLNKEIEGFARPTRLFSHNADVDLINHDELSKIKGEVREYRMTSKGKDFLIEGLKKSCLAPQVLSLKLGARVMFVKNNYEVGYVNGTLGEVTGFNSFDLPIIKTLHGKIIDVSESDWKIEEEGKVKAQINQLPLRLAWAITVHKSQGMSLDAMEVDLSKSFVAGMGYVALSRVRTLSGMKLLGINDIALKVNENVLEKDLEFQDDSKMSVLNLRELSIKEKEKRQKEFLDKTSDKSEKKFKEKKETTTEKTKRLLADKIPLKEIAEIREMTQETIVSHIEKLLEEGEDLDIDYLKRDFKYSELDEILSAFRETAQTGLTAVYNLLYKKKKKPSYLKLRLARLFLEK